jgi:hypothetical protein
MRRLIGKERSREGSAAGSYDALADEPRQPTVMFGLTATRNGLEARDWAPAVNDQNRRAPLKPIDEGAETILGFGNTGLFHAS